ncbi:MAG TPA: FecR domain-containing protein [Balneolales bacterium]|nr:FecR domain-containing protein [Balneolales bacterium]
MNWELMRRYLDGSITDEERRIFMEWLAEDPEHKEIVNKMKSIWHPPRRTSGKEWDLEKAYEATWEKIRKQQFLHTVLTPNIQPGGKPVPITKPRKDSWAGLYMKVAAVLMVGLVTVFILYYTGTFSPGKPDIAVTYHTITSNSGQRIKLSLSDGTKIVLAPESELKIPSTYNHPNRKVLLKGEAYFSVKHSDTHPFQVNINQSIVKDLGTKFDLRSYPSEDHVKVVVAHGKVSIQAPDVAQSTPLVVTPGYMGEINFNKKSAAVTPVDAKHFMSWINGDLSFKDASFPEIARSLKRWFDLKAVIYNKSLASQLITTRFSSRQPIDDVAQALALSLNLDYKVRNDTLFFYNKRKP